jgi:hypothetical protein
MGAFPTALKRTTTAGSQSRQRRRVSVGREEEPQRRTGDGRTDLWQGPSSCRTLKQRDPPRGEHRLQDLARSVGETSAGWRRESVPCRRSAVLASHLPPPLNPATAASQARSASRLASAWVLHTVLHTLSQTICGPISYVQSNITSNTTAHSRKDGKFNFVFLRGCSCVKLQQHFLSSGKSVPSLVSLFLVALAGGHSSGCGNEG